MIRFMINAELCTRKMSSIYPRYRKELHNIMMKQPLLFFMVHIRVQTMLFNECRLMLHTHTLINICVCVCMHACIILFCNGKINLDKQKEMANNFKN